MHKPQGNQPTNLDLSIHSLPSIFIPLLQAVAHSLRQQHQYATAQRHTLDTISSSADPDLLSDCSGSIIDNALSSQRPLPLQAKLPQPLRSCLSLRSFTPIGRSLPRLRVATSTQRDLQAHLPSQRAHRLQSPPRLLRLQTLQSAHTRKPSARPLVQASCKDQDTNS